MLVVAPFANIIWSASSADQPWPLTVYYGRLSVLRRQDEAKAKDLLEQLAAHGHAWSLFGLATLLTQAHNKPGGDPAEMARAAALYIQAADKGVAPACKNVANLYELGIGVPKDEVKALQWLQRAAKAGDPSAQVVLGRKLSMGEGVEKDEKQGFALFERVRPLATKGAGK